MKLAVDRANRMSLLLFLLFPVFIAVWLLLKPLPPLQDLPIWAYQGWLGAQLLTGHAAALRLFVPVHYPVPNMFAQVVLSALSVLVGPLLASKLLILLLLGSAVAVCLLAARTLTPARAGQTALVLLLLLGINSSFWDGYINYQFSIVLLLAYLLLRERTASWGIGFTGLLLFTCHASTFAAFVLLVGLEVLFERRRWTRLAALAPSLALLVWYVLGRRHAAMRSMQSGPLYSGLVHHVEYKVYTLTKMGPFHNLVDYNGNSFALRDHRMYLAGVVLNVVFVLLLGWAVTPGLWRAVRQEPRDPLLLSSLFLFGLFLIMPSEAFSVINLGERFLYAAVALLLFRAGELRSLGPLAALGVCGLALTAGEMLTMPTAQAASAAAPASYNWGSGEAYLRFGLYDSRLYQMDQYRVFLQSPQNYRLLPLFFDTSLLLQRHPTPQNSGAPRLTKR